jgi:type IV fimbrial biogenesis protein FimT
MNQHATATPQRQFGFTLIESMVCLAVLSITIGAAAPSIRQASERRHLEGAAAQLATDIRHARSSAVALSTPVRLSFQQAGAGSCYMLHTGRAGDCQCNPDGVAVCSNGAQAIKTVGFAASSGLQLTSNSASMLFDHDRGTVTPTASINLRVQNGATIRQVVNIMGRARSCTPSGNLAGYPAC